MADTKFSALPLTQPASTDTSPFLAGATPSKSTFLQAALAARFVPTSVQTSGYSANANELVLGDTTSASFNVTLPTGVADKTWIAVKQVIRGGTNTISVLCSGSDVFNRVGGGTTSTVTVTAQINTYQYNASAGIWYIISSDVPLSQTDLRYLQLANNLSDVASASTARTNLGLTIGTNVQAYNAYLAGIAGLTPSNDDILQLKAGVWSNRTIAQYKTDLTLVKGDVGLGNVDNTSNATERAATRTLSNARITRRVTAVTQSATPTINTDNMDVASITALAQAITSMTTNLTGTPVAGDTLIIQITDNATARAITWGTSFEASTVALPTTTVISTMLMVGFIWNTATSKWRCVAVA